MWGSGMAVRVSAEVCDSLWESCFRGRVLMSVCRKNSLVSEMVESI